MARARVVTGSPPGTASRPARIPAPLLVLAAVVSVQFGGALAQGLVLRTPLGPGGVVVMRLAFATAIMLAVVRPRWRRVPAAAWRTVIAFGLALGLMNYTFYASLAHLPIGIAVTIEFIGPLTLAAVLSRRWSDAAAVVAAGLGVVLISQAHRTPVADVPWTGLGLALAAGACWAAYIVFSGKAGAQFPRLDGLALALVVATLVTLPFGVTSVPTWQAPWVAIGLGVALLSSVLPYSLELLALRRLSAKVFGILLSLEPAVAALAGLLVLGQRLSLEQLVGMAMVVGASALVLGLGARGQPQPAEAAGA